MSKRSICWKFMTTLSTKQVKCDLCGLTLSFTNGSTTSLNRHLSSRHILELEAEKNRRAPKRSSLTHQSFNSDVASTSAEKVMPATEPDTKETSIPTVQPAIDTVIENLKPYGPHSSKKQLIDRLILDLCVLDMQPLSVVENRGFKALLYALDPRYKIVSRKTLAEVLLPKVYLEKKMSLIQDMRNIEDIAVTTDQWTSCSNDGFTTVTAHYVTDDWTISSPVLMTRSTGNRHTAENLAFELQEVFTEFHISEKISTVVTDNAKNATKAVRLTDTDNQRCFAHTLNLVVRHALDDDESMSCIKKVKAIATFFSASTIANQALKSLHANQQTKMIKIKNDVVTRWNSTFQMLNSYLPQHKEVTAVLCLQGRNDLVIADPDTEILHKVMAILEPFFIATEELSSEQFTSISKIIPVVRLLKMKCLKTDNSLAIQLRKYLDLYLGTVEENRKYRISTFVDPKFKERGFSNTHNAQRAIDDVVEELKGMEEENHISEESVPAAPEPKKSNCLWEEFDDETANEEETVAVSLSAVDIELKFYREATRLDRHDNSLRWWKQHAGMMPKLSKLAKKHLGTPATSVPSERVFSKAGELVSSRRSNLKKCNVDMILFLNKIKN